MERLEGRLARIPSPEIQVEDGLEQPKAELLCVGHDARIAGLEGMGRIVAQAVGQEDSRRDGLHVVIGRERRRGEVARTSWRLCAR